MRYGSHSVFNLNAHIVFVTKFRHKVLSEAHLRRFAEAFKEICGDFETELLEFNGERYHVHLLINYPPKVALSALINSLKGVSSRTMRREFAELDRHYWRDKALWTKSYFASSAGGAPLKVLEKYIQNQQRPS